MREPMKPRSRTASRQRYLRSAEVAFAWGVAICTCALSLASCASTKPKESQASVEAMLRAEFPGAILGVDAVAGEVRVVSSAWEDLSEEEQKGFAQRCSARIARAGGAETVHFLVNGQEVAVSDGVVAGMIEGRRDPSLAPRKELPEDSAVYSEADPSTEIAVEEAPILLSFPPPVYPSEARKSETEGQVVVKALVGTDGRVHKTIVVHSVYGLDDAAVVAVQEARFTPAMSDGKPVAVWVQIPLRFHLN